MPDPTADSVPFDEAIGFLKQKVDLPTRAWTDLWQGQHSRAFVVAGAMDAALIADFHGAVLKAIENGTTLDEFRKDFDRIVARHGWSYNGSRGWRSRVIFDTNMRMARAAGRWEQAQRVKKRRPFLRYIATLDERTRPEHRAWHGTILPIDHAFWHTHIPPNGWNCRCTIQSLSERDLQRKGLQVTDPPNITTEARRINTPDGPVMIDLPKGIDPGFAYNPGRAATGHGADTKAMEAHGGFNRLDAPGGNKPALLNDLVPVSSKTRIQGKATGESALRSSLRTALGADEVVLTDPVGTHVRVGQAIVDHMLESTSRLDGRETFFPFIPELVTDPAEIWVGFAANDQTGRVVLRRRYLKLIKVSKDRTISLVTDQDNGQWSGFTFFRGGLSAIKNMRTGLRVFSNEGG